MDPCPFVRLIVESLALKLPTAAKPAAAVSGGVHPSTTPCYAKLNLPGFPSQTTLLPLSTTAPDENSDGVVIIATPSSSFHLDPETLRRLKCVTLKISVYTGRMGRRCGVGGNKRLGSVQVRVDLGQAQARAAVYHGGWMKLGGGETAARLHATVRSEPDPRFVFQFGGEPESSPVVFQMQGNVRQPVFSCKFTADRSNRSRSLPSDFNTTNRGWMMRTLSLDKDRSARDHQRKGWMLIVYDLSGSAVAAASMVTPFVPSPGSDRVSRSNPGAWLILRPNGVSISSWKPWGRLEAWRERGSIDGLGYKFELVPEPTRAGISAGIPIAEGTMSVKKGGRFCIDESRTSQSAIGRENSNLNFPQILGFVMAASVEGEGKVSKPVVEVAAAHVTCTADAALFVALSAAVDLSMDACRLFSQKLGKEFSSDENETFS